MGYIIYTDGGCWPNPGLGAWAIVITKDDKIIEKRGMRRLEATNNIVEIRAIIEALEEAKKLKEKVIIRSDSQYAIDSITKWSYKWKINGWKKGSKKDSEIKNLELIKEAHLLYDEIKHIVIVEWVRGHNGNKWNELADEMCYELINYQND